MTNETYILKNIEYRHVFEKKKPRSFSVCWTIWVREHLPQKSAFAADFGA
jgi:hypothetical protein